MSTFEFKDYHLALTIAGKPFTVNCVAELVETMQVHQDALVELAAHINEGIKNSFDAVTLCKEILDDILGEHAFADIFTDKEPTLTDCSDVLKFVIEEITKFMQQE